MNNGNDTIDPYPLIPKGAAKILIVKRDIFEELKEHYLIFCRGLIKAAKKSSLISKTKRPLSPKGTLVTKRYFGDYEATNAIHVNECDYRRWCRVSEWFAQFGPDAEKNERMVLIQ